MYDNLQSDIAPASAAVRSRQLPTIGVCLFVTLFAVATSRAVMAQTLASTSVMCKVSGASEKIELTTSSSKILTLDKNIPRVQVNNPDLLAVTPLSATQVQISAKKAGVTQVNLWDDEGKIHSVDVLIYGDARELEIALQTQFPHASIRVFRYSESLVLTGFVDRADHVSPIMQLAQDYSPKVINNIQVGGVQQVLLKTKVMEISRTKLRRLATDFTWLDSNGSFFSTGVSGLLTNTSNNTSGFQSVLDTSGKAAEFGIVGDHGAFFGFIDWLQQNNVAKILSDPNIMAVSGRPAQFNVGGEIPIVVPQSLGTASIEFKPFGTQIDFLPIVLGNGKIRLEVRPRISEIDDSRSIIVQNFVIPALTVRQIDTAVEMNAGQTFALAGLIQERTKTAKRGLPYVQDMPIIGVPFRRTEDETNEIELLILVTPEFVDPIDPCEAPCGGPGTYTTSPTNRGLYCGGYMEVPTACNPTQGLSACGQNPCGTCGGCSCNGGMPAMNGAMPMQEMPVPAGVRAEGSMNGALGSPTMITDQNDKSAVRVESNPPAATDITLPSGASDAKSSKATEQPKPVSEQPKSPGQPVPTPLPPPQQPAPKANEKPAMQPEGPMPNKGASSFQTTPAARGYEPLRSPANTAASQPASNYANADIGPVYSNSGSYTPPRQPVFVRNASNPNNPQAQQWKPANPPRESSLIGPIGYDVQQ
jgi:pilus assembly protein CpaC